MNHPADIRHFAELDADARHEAAIESVSIEIYDALLSTGHDDVDDERLVISIDAAELRKAYALHKSGAFDAALTAFIALTEAAADKVAGEECHAMVERRSAESREEAAADHYENLREDRRLG